MAFAVPAAAGNMKRERMAGRKGHFSANLAATVLPRAR